MAPAKHAKNKARVQKNNVGSSGALNFMHPDLILCYVKGE
jgi:hypothetical protein